MLPPSDFAEPDLNSWLAARGVTLSEERGYAPESAKALVNLANVLALEEDYENSYQLASRALEIAYLLNGDAVRPRILYTLSCYINHWLQPLSQSRQLGDETFQLCQETGEVAIRWLCISISSGHE